MVLSLLFGNYYDFGNYDTIYSENVYYPIFALIFEYKPDYKITVSMFSLKKYHQIIYFFEQHNIYYESL